MKILIAPDSFKESLQATQVAEAIAEGIKTSIPDAICKLLPFSDGGEGAFEVLEALNLGALVNTTTYDPLGRIIEAPYFAFTDNKTAWIELSQASGLALLKNHEQNPLNTSTFGTGIQIKKAIEAGLHNIILGIGGSATHDVATGIFTALGGRLLDAGGHELKAGGASLQNCKSLDFSQLIPELQKTHFTIACDVTNPLIGPNGAAHTYAAQKGAHAAMIEQLEKATRSFSKLLEVKTQKDIANQEGAGAAGGTAAGMLAFTNARLKNGFDILAELTNLEERIQTADLIITGEGRTDDQSRFGKVPFKIANLAKKYNKPVLLYSGGITANPDILSNSGFTATFALKTPEMSLDFAKQNAFKLLAQKVTDTIKQFI